MATALRTPALAPPRPASFAARRAAAARAPPPARAALSPPAPPARLAPAPRLARARAARAPPARSASLALSSASLAHEPRRGLDAHALLEAGWGSIALLAATLLSLFLANQAGTGATWVNLWEHVHFGPAPLGLHLSLREWVNEGLMALFFFVVGVDIKKEFVYGSLASVRKAVLPCLGALGGMLVPMAVYCALNGAGRAGASAAGWAVPMATDIAFAMGVFGFFKARMPAGAEAFLLTLATVDDLGAIAVITVFFAGALSLPHITAAAAICCGLAVASKKASEAHLGLYAVAGVALWYCLLQGGINADIAGVATAMALPAPPAAEGEETLLDRLHHALAPATAFLIMPIFALANTAVSLAGSSLGSFAASPVSQGIALGLLLGKPAGIAAFALLGIRLRLASWPTGMGISHLLAVGVLGGIGFTMSLFLIGCSFATAPAAAANAKLAVLAGSAAAAVLGGLMLSRFPVVRAEEKAALA